MYYIRSRSTPWRKVSEDKAKSYLKVLLKSLDYRAPESQQKDYLKRFIMAPNIDDFIKENGGEYFEQ